MLSEQDNHTLTQVGRGTPMGDYLRSHWVPALLEEEVAEVDGPPTAVRLLGEDFVVFRDSNGDLGFLDAFCPHRRAPMVLGRNEECGLRCVYHGWKFDTTGQCVDLPSEPPTSVLRERVRIDSYPVRAAGGVVWVFLGSPSTIPDGPPALPWTTLPPGHRLTSKRLQETNWVQALEGGIDSSHVGFLHRSWKPSGARMSDRELAPISVGPIAADEQVRAMRYMTDDGHPRFHIEHSDFGFWIGARRSIVDSNQYYWRITPYLLPFYTIIPPMATDVELTRLPFSGHAFVPIDDHHTWVYNISWHESREFDSDERARMQSEDGTHAPTDDQYRPFANMRNMYNIDREMQRLENFTGIKNAGTQDRAVQELMGPIVDRSKESLGTTDKAIIAFRRLILGLARGDETARAADAHRQPAKYAVRSASLTLTTDADFVVEAGDRLYGAERS